MENEKSKKTVILMTISIVFMLLCIIASAFILKLGSNQLTGIKKELTQVKNEVEKKKLSSDALKRDAVTRVSGLDTKRAEEDQAKAEEMLKKIFTFSSSAEYIKNRQEFIEKYKPSEDFLNKFYSDIKAFEHLDANAKPVNTIDQRRYVSDFTKLKAVVVNIQGDKYSYFGEFKTNFKMEDGRINNPDNTMAVMYTIDKDGNFSDMKIWGLPNAKGVLIDG